MSLTQIRSARISLRSRVSKWARWRNCAGGSSSTFYARCADAWSYRRAFSLALDSWGAASAAPVGGAAWFLVLHVARNSAVVYVSVLATLPLMATDRESRVSQPASFSAELPIVLSHPPGLWLADPATAVSSLRLLGIATGVGVARPRLLPWTAICAFTFAVLNLLLASPGSSAGLSQRGNREIMGIVFPFLACNWGVP
jgi:hypothetical protein